MLSTTLRAAFPQKSHARHTLINLYSTVAELTRTHWRTGAHPTPKSLVADEDDEYWPSPQKEELPSVSRELEEAATSESTRPLPHRPYPPKPDKRPTPREFVAHRDAMKKKFPEGWAPPRKVSREAMDAMRQLHKLSPEKFTTPVLADKFRISKEAVRRILRSKWQPTREEMVRMAERENQARSKWKVQKKVEEIEAFQKDQRKSSRRSEDKLTLT